jgi:hypothetical protein
MEHFCTRCEWFALDNTRGPVVCPACGAPVRHSCDELPDRPDSRDDLDERDPDDD